MQNIIINSIYYMKPNNSISFKKPINFGHQINQITLFLQQRGIVHCNFTFFYYFTE